MRFWTRRKEDKAYTSLLAELTMFQKTITNAREQLIRFVNNYQYEIRIRNAEKNVEDVEKLGKLAKEGNEQTFYDTYYQAFLLSSLRYQTSDTANLNFYRKIWNEAKASEKVREKVQEFQRQNDQYSTFLENVSTSRPSTSKYADENLRSFFETLESNRTTIQKLNQIITRYITLITNLKKNIIPLYKLWERIHTVNHQVAYFREQRNVFFYHCIDFLGNKASLDDFHTVNYTKLANSLHATLKGNGLLICTTMASNPNSGANIKLCGKLGVIISKGIIKGRAEGDTQIISRTKRTYVGHTIPAHGLREAGFYDEVLVRVYECDGVFVEIDYAYPKYILPNNVLHSIKKDIESHGIKNFYFVRNNIFHKTSKDVFWTLFTTPKE